MSNAYRRRLQRDYGLSPQQADQLFQMLEEDRIQRRTDTLERRSELTPADIAEQQLQNQMLREETRQPYIQQMQDDMQNAPSYTYTPPEPEKEDKGSVFGFLGDSIGSTFRTAGRFLNPFGDSFLNFTESLGNEPERIAEEHTDAQRRVQEQMNSFLDASSFGLLSSDDVAKDRFLGNLAGYVTGFGALGLGLRGVQAIGNNPISRGAGHLIANTQGRGLGGRALQRAKEGAGIEALWTGSDIAMRELLTDPDRYNAQENLMRFGVNVGAGAVADPIFGEAFQQAGRLWRNRRGGQTPEAEVPQAQGRTPEDLIRLQARANVQPDLMPTSANVRNLPQGQQLPTQEILGLPAPEMTQGIRATRTGYSPRLRYEEFAQRFREEGTPSVGREAESMQDFWASMAEPTEPSLEIMIDSAYGGLSVNIDDALQRLRMRASAGVPLDFTPQYVDVPANQYGVLGEVAQPRTQMQRTQQQQQQPNIFNQLVPDSSLSRQATPTPSSTNQADRPRSLFNLSPKRVSEDAIDRLPKGVKQAQRFNEQYFNRFAQGTQVSKRLVNDRLAKIDADLKTTKDDAVRQALETERATLRAEKEIIDKFKVSSLEQSLHNVATAFRASRHFLERNFREISNIFGGDSKQMYEGMEYMASKNLLWRLENGFIDESYKLPKGWTFDHLRDIVRQGDNNPQYQQLTEHMRRMNLEQLEKLWTSGNISRQEFDALAQNPYYIPLYRDSNWRQSNVDLSRKPNRSQQDTDTLYAGANVVHALEEGNIEDFFTNPLETIIRNSHAIETSVVRNEVGRQLLRLADIDPDFTFVKRVNSPSQAHMQVMDNGQAHYLQLDDGIQDLIEEMGNIDIGRFGKLTSFVSGLKTRSTEFMLGTSVYRDLMTAFPNLTPSTRQIFQSLASMVRRRRNPEEPSIDDLANLSAVGRHRDVDELGATFGRRAYLQADYGTDVNSVHQDLMKQFRTDAGIKQVGAKDVGRFMDNIIFGFGKWLGNKADTLPRAIESEFVHRTFQPRIDKVSKEYQNLYQRHQNSPTPETEQALMRVEGELKDLVNDMVRMQKFHALDIMNYGRMGKSKFSKAIRKGVMFANTTTQAKNRLARSFHRNPVRTSARILATQAPLIGLHAWAFMSLTDDAKEKYKQIPSFYKDFNYVFMNEDGTQVFSIPKVQEVAIFQNFLESMYTGENFEENFELMTQELLPFQLGTVLSDTIMREEDEGFFDALKLPATIITPVIESAMNKKAGFNQKPISYNPSQADPYTSEVFTNLFGDSPDADKAQHIVRQTLGDYGKYGLAGLDFLADPSEESGQNFIQQINPLQDRYYAEEGFMSDYFKNPHFEREQQPRGRNALGNELTQRFNEELSNLRSERSEARDEARSMIRSQYPNLNENEVSRLVDEMSTFEREQEYQTYLRLARELDPIIYQMESVQNSTDLSEQEKEQQIQMLRQQENAITQTIRQMLGW